MLKNESQLFGDIYLWFADILYLPDENIFSPEHLVFLEEVNNKLMETDISDEITLFTNVLSSEEVDLQSIKIEHSKLFIGPFSLKAPPYESYYTGNENVTNNSVMKMLSFIKNAGLDISEDFKDAPDHIVMELSFISELCYAEHLALKNENEKKQINSRRNTKYFLTYHLLKWITDFRKAVDKGASGDFYPAVIKMLEKILINHYQLLIAS